MFGYARLLLILLPLTCLLSTCQSKDHEECDIYDSDETDACFSRDHNSDAYREQELTYIEMEDIHHQSWFSSIYYTILDAFDYLKEQIVQSNLPEPTQRKKSEENRLKTENLDDMMVAAREMAKEFFAGDELSLAKINDAFKETKLSEEEEADLKKDKGEYEYPPVYRIDPGHVGDVQYIDINDGVKAELITKANRPPIFEIPNFLSDEDCDYIIERSREKGLNKSSIFGTKNDTETGSHYGTFRESFSSYLRKDDVEEEFFSRLHDRLAKLLRIPKKIVQWSENLSIGMYKPGGHYHAHQDSNEASSDTPCCFQKLCFDSNGTKTTFIECCRLCRFATVLYYLNDVEEGGETAFPFADLSYGEMVKKGETDWENLTSHCHSASLVIKPEKGKALLWYNHPLDSRGYISSVDKRSYHGGCEVIKGTKWIATNWISTPAYSERFIPSIFRDFT
ncbi:uncharacterized protein LOC132733449 [Ruditapes philippinarum]|uniref:uncharacterized protein LOC132733449 n=1 Tax=Ruditapes philippinarum TaxID=129788 RepID=UPI00295AF007|nr:uncharacterized protein LOC132733449 [Ruditapes philippinarum]